VKDQLFTTQTKLVLLDVTNV